MAQEALVAALPGAQVAAIQLGDAGGHVLQEAAVVGDQHDGTAKLAQLLLQPFDGGNIQVVGGFVQEQKIGVGDQCPGQGHAPPPAAGEFAHRRVLGQLQLGQGGFHPLLQVPAVDGLQLLLYPRQLVQVRVAVLQQVVVVPQQLAGLRQALGDHVVHALVVGFRQRLQQARHLDARALPALAAVRHLLSRQYPQQGGLAGAVAAEQTPALAAVDVQADPVQQGVGAVVQLQVVEA